ncbi:MAG: GGDEF domain-containing protein [Pseudomonadota bacterium]
MALPIDMTTLVIDTCVAALFSTIAMIYVWLVHRRDPAIRYWSLSFLVLGLSMALIAAHRLLPTAITVAVSNVLAVGGLVLMRTGTAIFARRPRYPLLGVFLLALIAGVSVGWGVISPDYRVRVTVFGLIMSLLVMLMASDLWAARHGQQRLIVLSMAVLYAILVVMTLVRSAHAYWVDAGDTLFRGGVIEALFFFVTQAALFFVPFGFLLMTSQRLQLRLDRLANEDELTGVLNRRAFLARSLELLASTRSDATALMVLDIDNFKALNDSHGHAAGDAVLRQFARLIAAQLRPQDLFARVGGEEFWVLLPDTDAAGAQALAERLRAAVENAAMLFGRTRLAVTVSIGVSPVHEADISGALAAADRAMYEAKSRGRNQVIAA